MQLTSITLEPSSTEIGIGGISVIWAVCDISPCPTLTWSISDPTIVELEISPSTLSCSVTGISNGSVNVTAHADNITSNQIIINVTGSSLQSIEIGPKTANIGITKTSSFTATCRDQNNSFISCPTLTWHSSNPLVGTIDQMGILTGRSGGTTEITASGGGKISDVALVTVSPTELGNLILFGGIIIGAVYMILKRSKFKTT
jgi:uncharacterized protein YjdB